MSRVVRGLILPLALVAMLTGAAGRSEAQGCATSPPAYNLPAVSYYYTPPAVPFYAPPAMSYYPPPTISYYAPPVASYYAAPAVSYYAPPAYPAATVTTRYGLFGRPRVTVAQYYAP